MRITLNVHSIGGGTELCWWKNEKRSDEFLFAHRSVAYNSNHNCSRKFQHTVSTHKTTYYVLPWFRIDCAIPSDVLSALKGRSFLQRAFHVRNGECFTRHWHYSRLTDRNSRKSIPLFQDLLLLSENCLWFANSWRRSGLKNSRLLWLKDNLRARICIPIVFRFSTS